MNKKLFVVSLCMICSLSALTAQVSVDPNDRFYAEAQSWELKGIVETLPQLRPYPLHVIHRIIESVIAVGLNDDGTVVPRYKRDVELALYEYERIFSKPYRITLEGGGSYVFKEFRYPVEDAETGKESFDKEHEKARQLQGEGAVEGDITFSKWVTAGYHLGIWGTSADYDDVAPMYKFQEQDSIFDASSVGPFEAYLNWNCNVAVGTADYYATAGLSRVGFGPFLTGGLALNEKSYHAANLMINVTRPKWSFATLYETIGATNNIGTEGDITDNKYLSFHSLRYRLSQHWTVSYYENLIFGPQSNILYMVPAPYMALQNIGGAQSNLQMGLMLEFRPVQSLNLIADFFADDMSIDELVKLHLDSKQHVAGQFGVVFTPMESSLTYMTLNYTIVMPYTYAHWEYNDSVMATLEGNTWNYQNYTNNGMSIGASIPPNSDRVEFFARFTPTKNFKLDVQGTFVRHQNVAEAFSDDDKVKYMFAKTGKYRTDGSIFTHQVFESDGEIGDHVEAAWDQLSFMAGKHSMLVCQLGFAGQYTFPKVGKGQLAIKLGYTFEYIHNAGVDKDVYTGQSTAAEITKDANGNFVKGTYKGTFYGDTSQKDSSGNSGTYETAAKAYEAMYNAALADADAAYESWVDNLHDRVNHYISLSLKYMY